MHLASVVGWDLTACRLVGRAVMQVLRLSCIVSFFQARLKQLLCVRESESRRNAVQLWLSARRCTIIVVPMRVTS